MAQGGQEQSSGGQLGAKESGDALYAFIRQVGGVTYEEAVAFKIQKGLWFGVGRDVADVLALGLDIGVLTKDKQTGKIRFVTDEEKWQKYEDQRVRDLTGLLKEAVRMARDPQEIETMLIEIRQGVNKEEDEPV